MFNKCWEIVFVFVVIRSIVMMVVLWNKLVVMWMFIKEDVDFFFIFIVILGMYEDIV